MISNSRVDREAARWLIEALQPDFAQWQQLDAWLSADTRHLSAYMTLAAAWGVAAAGSAGRLPDPATCERHEPAGWRFSPRNALARAPVRALSAGFVLLACIGILWTMTYSAAWQEYGTGIGEQRQIVLSDGTRVQLDTRTAIRVRMGKKRREVQLLRGAALFTVVHDRQRPFAVTAAAMVLQDIGTEFSVSSSGRDASVVVRAGQVGVDCDNHYSCAAVLRAGDEATRDSGRLRIVHLQANELERQLTWARGYLVFEDAPIEEVVASLNRYRQRPLRIADPRVAAIRFGGVIQTDHANEFESVLARLGVRAEPSGSNPDEIDLLPAQR